MKPLVLLLVAALATAIAALVLDSPLLVLIAVVAIGIVTLGSFVLSAQSAQAGDFLVPYVGILASALFLAALGVGAVVFGERGDAPGLVMLGIALITSVVVGAYALGLRTARVNPR